MSETFENRENQITIRKKPENLKAKFFQKKADILQTNKDSGLADNYLKTELKQIKEPLEAPEQKDKNNKPNEPLNSDPSWTDNLINSASDLWRKTKDKALEVWSKITGKEVDNYYNESYQKIEALQNAQNSTEIKRITSTQKALTLKKFEGNDPLSKKLNGDMEIGLMYANNIFPGLKNSFLNNPEIQNFINNPESITAENWEKITILIDQKIIPEFISQNPDIEFRYRTFVIQRLRIKASQLILEQITKNAEKKVKKNEISDENSDQLITHARTALIQTQINDCENHGIQLQNKIEAITKQRPNLSAIFKKNAEDEALNIYFGQIKLINIIEQELRRNYLLTSEELNFDPENPENMNIIRSNHSDLENQELAEITILLKQRKMALAQISNDQLMAEQIIFITQAKLEGKNETETARIQDKLNYKYYQNDYDNLEKTYAGYQIILKNQNISQQLTMQEVALITYALYPDKISDFENATKAIDSSDANITDIHIEGNKIIGKLTTNWQYKTAVEIPLNGDKLIIQDLSAENGFREANLNDFEDVKNTVLTVDISHELTDTAFNRGDMAKNESLNLSKIKDRELKALTTKLTPNLSLLQNEFERRNFFTNLLTLLTSSDQNNEIRELDTVEERLKILTWRLSSHTNRRNFIDYLKEKSPEDFINSYNQNFTEFLNELGLMETKR